LTLPKVRSYDSGVSESDLPPLFDRWAGAFLPGPIPRETLATCSDCAMGCPKNSREVTPEDLYFDLSVKCCSYIPSLSNFQVGRILGDQDPAMAEGRASTEKRLAAGHEVLPLGIRSSAAEDEAYAKVVRDRRFGRAPEHRCPHYVDREGGLCGIWRHRPPSCVTWFCRFVRGRTGARFWQSMRHLLQYLELELREWCVAEIGLETEAYRHLFGIHRSAADSKDRLSEEERRRAWGSWLGKEREFYRECGRLADGLSWAQIAEIGGPRLRPLLAIVRDSYAELVSEKMPAQIFYGKFSGSSLDTGVVRLWGTSKYHPVELSLQAFQALLPLTSGTPEEVRAQFERAGGEPFGLDQVRLLLDLGILAEEEAPQAEGPREEPPVA